MKLRAAQTPVILTAGRGSSKCKATNEGMQKVGGESKSKPRSKTGEYQPPKKESAEDYYKQGSQEAQLYRQDHEHSTQESFQNKDGMGLDQKL